MEREEVRALIRAHRPSSGTGYPEEIRQKVVVYARQRRAKGQHWAHIGMEIGLSSTTLVNWSQPRRKVPPVAVVDTTAEQSTATPTQGQFLPVAVIDKSSEASVVARLLPTPTHCLILHTPAGFRLEGLDLQQALALLEVLR